MRIAKSIYIILFFILSNGQAIAQTKSHQKAYQHLNERGEVILKLNRPSRSKLDDLTKIVSIDAVHSDYIRVYANLQQFERFLQLGMDFTVMDHPARYLLDRPKSFLQVTSWQVYPSYQQYDSLMQEFVNNHPDICRLDTFGLSEEGRLLLAIKVSDNVNEDEPEPEFLYTSSIHGDEIGAYVLMLRFIDYLLNNYGSDEKITRLVDGAEIWINPLANPDGTYHGGNHSVFGAIRGNSNGIDLNRNYPDPQDGPHPDGQEYQAETLAMMAFSSSRNFSMSANFHAGEEVVNYPWDTWPRRHADDDWFQYISHEYADTVHAYSSGYMTGFDNGITNGYDWYSINGGRQDYITYFTQGRETTIELDDSDITPENQLDQLWNYNYRSLLNYACQVLYGIQGFVTDAESGTPVPAKIKIQTHDFDSSNIYSDTTNGYFVRLLNEGSYDLSFSAEGYYSAVIQGVEVINYETTQLNIPLIPVSSSIEPVPGNLLDFNLYPNPFTKDITISLNLQKESSLSFVLLDLTGRTLYRSNPKFFPSGITEEKLLLPVFSPGTYILQVQSNGYIVSRPIVRQ